ncbi:MAG: multiheme c-type cytochrome [Planctomycetota bacterium]
MERQQRHLFPLAALAAALGSVTAGAIMTACSSQPDAVAPADQPAALLASMGPLQTQSADEMHAQVFAENGYPTAAQCGECHPKHFAEWSVSPHAYAQISPVFNAMQGSVTKLTNGANADFCIRCHSPVGMALDEPVFTPNKNRAQASVEGVTCIVCHRVAADAGKISGRFKLEKGDIHAPIFGPGDGSELQRVLAEAMDPEGLYPGLKPHSDADGDFPIHGEIKPSFFLTESGMCGSCHDVTSPGGFRLEEAFSEYKNSPAAKRGESCQDCHMSRTEGSIWDGPEDIQAVAIMNGVPSKSRKVSSHYFAGPDYSIVHPGVFPIMRGEDSELATLTEWHDFDLSWGREEFESSVPEGTDFKHEVWESAKNRKRAHEIIYGKRGQIEKLETYRKRQLDVMRAGYQLGDVKVSKSSDSGIKFSVQARNGTDGHNVPTGFIAERTLFIETTVYDSEGTPVFKSGDTDPNGDVRDLHSVYVHNGALPLDKFLFSLQSKFIVRLFRGGEREQVLAVNLSADPLPFTRPSPTPTIGTGRPVGARTHRVGLPPKGKRWADYSIKKSELTGKGPYTAKVRMIAGMVPINLVHEIRHVGFDYGMNPRQIGDRVVAGRQVLWEGEFALDQEGPVAVEWDTPEPAPIDWWQVPEKAPEEAIASGPAGSSAGATEKKTPLAKKTSFTPTRTQGDSGN